jgi:geranylgeranyl transferase type-2 subunit beta
MSESNRLSDRLPYLHRLTLRLADGIDRLSEQFRRKQSDWLRLRLNEDGGFSGREGASDLYYTGFALRGLAVAQGLNPELCNRAASFLRAKMAEPASVIDLFSLLVSCSLVTLGGGPDLLAEVPADWPDRVAGALESFRTADGGYAKAQGSASGSTYHTFLVLLARELLDRPAPCPDKLVRFVRSRRRNDGGFVEIAPMRRSGTNPTADAVGILQITDSLDDEVKVAVSDFLARLPSPFEGGLRANDRIPAADLLSTFTGTWTLAQLGALERLNVQALREYAESCAAPEGGFRGGLWDEGVDVEYTFYGIGTLGLLADETASTDLIS